jgi:hypothetical protein
VQALAGMQVTCRAVRLYTAACICARRFLAVGEDCSMVENPSWWAPNDKLECAERHAYEASLSLISFPLAKVEAILIYS